MQLTDVLEREQKLSRILRKRAEAALEPVKEDWAAYVLATIKDRFLSFTMVLGTGFLLLVSLVISAGISALSSYLGSILPGSDFLWQVINIVLTLGIIAVMFALLFKFLPDVQIAWSDVWICPRADGHLQAVGRDARGRKQYRYHPRWRAVRDRTKYERMVAFAKALPRIRRRLLKDMRRAGLSRDKVLATVVQLLESTQIRIGNEEYARENRSYGLTTMRDHHVEVSSTRLRFRFRGKSGKMREIAVTATFKHRKDGVAAAGYNPAATCDAIYFDDPRRGAFVRLDRPLYEEIQRGKIRL